MQHWQPTRAGELRGQRLLRHRHHALDVAANAPLVATRLLDRRLTLNIEPNALRNAIFNVVGNPTFASRAAVRGHRPVPAKAFGFFFCSYGCRHATLVGDEGNDLCIRCCRCFICTLDIRAELHDVRRSACAHARRECAEDSFEIPCFYLFTYIRSIDVAL
jgi:hypothetical protein